MPQVFCSHCGEELMGSVNRCWKCGRTFVAEYNPQGLPPIRRRPIPADLVNKSRAELMTPTAAASGGVGSTTPDLNEAAAWEAEVVATAAEPARTAEAASASEAEAANTSKEVATSLVGDESRGSSAAVVHAPPAMLTASSPQTAPYHAPPATPRYPLNAGATGGAIAAVVLGAMALAALRIVAPGALLVSVLGVGMGVWGLNSDRRGLAVFGLVLCCLAMAIAGFFTAIQLYTLVNGYSPFESDLPPIDPGALQSDF